VSPYSNVPEATRRMPSRRSQSQDVVGIGRSALLSGSGDRQEGDRQEGEAGFAATQWWLSEAKRMREAAVKMRRERDRFRVAVEDAHFECRRLAAQVQELQTQLRHTQIALRESKTMADAARRELERLRHWIEEAHDESRRLSVDVQEYEWQLHETRITLDDAERSCQELKNENEDKDSELVALQEELRLTSAGESGAQRDKTKTQRLEIEEARAELQDVRKDLKATSRDLKDERISSNSLREQLSSSWALAAQLQAEQGNLDDGIDV